MKLHGAWAAPARHGAERERARAAQRPRRRTIRIVLDTQCFLYLYVLCRVPVRFC